MGSEAQGGDGVQGPGRQKDLGPRVVMGSGAATWSRAWSGDGACQSSLNLCLKIFDEGQAELPETSRPFEQINTNIYLCLSVCVKFKFRCKVLMNV